MHTITDGLIKAGHEVKIMTIYTHKHDLELDKCSEEYVEQTGIEGIFVDTRVNLVDAFSTLITQDSYNVSRFFSTDFDIRLTKLLRRHKFDVIHLESLFMTPYIGTIRRFSKAKVVLRSHNLEYIIWERVASGTRNIAKRAYIKHLSKQLKNYELDVITRMDGIVSISEEDRLKYEKLGLKKPLINIPFGIDVKKYEVKNQNTDKAIFHLGSMDWRPNIEAVLWFLEDIWPLVHKKHPELKFYIAGRNMPADFMDMNYPNVEMIGEVENAQKFMQSKRIMVVPLLSAGGIRVKIIEGMALGKCVISTSIGAEGIDAEDNKQIKIANEPEEFVNAITDLLDDETSDQMQLAAREYAETSFDNSVLIDRLVDFYNSLLSR